MASRYLGTTGLIISLVAMGLSVPIAAGTVQEEGTVRLASPEEGEAIV